MREPQGTRRDTGSLESARLIAGLVGPLFTAIAVSMLVNRDAFPGLAATMSRDYGLIFLSGGLLLVAGIAIIRAHNVWVGGWPVIVTLLGWLAIVGGVVRMLFFRHAPEIVAALVPTTTMAAGAAGVMLALGVFLTVKGYRMFE